MLTALVFLNLSQILRGAPRLFDGFNGVKSSLDLKDSKESSNQ